MGSILLSVWDGRKRSQMGSVHCEEQGVISVGNAGIMLQAAMKVLCQCRMGMVCCEALFHLCVEQFHGLKAKSSANLRL